MSVTRFLAGGIIASVILEAFYNISGYEHNHIAILIGTMLGSGAMEVARGLKN